MPEIIQDWLATRLGVLLDMTHKHFGLNTKDGKLLAKLLYGYGVLPEHILNNVKESQNYYECLNNLVLLKPWLRHIGVTYDDSTLQKMACGEGSAAISIFYAVYLNLERKDRLHYLSAQKERRFTNDNCSRFKVDWVPERMVRGDSGDSAARLAAPLLERRDIIDWHKANCKQIVDKIKKTKAKFRKVVQKERRLGPPISKHVTSIPLDKRQIEADEMKGNITAFEKKHVQDSPNLDYSQLIELQNLYGTQPCPAPSLSEAKNIVGNIRRRKKGDIYARSFQQKMQHILLDEQWKEIIEKQGREFEDTVCANLLKQSQYEKQMANKLCMIRHQKKVLAENRRKIESLKIEQYQKEYDEEVQRNMEMLGEAWEDEEFEKERITELHRRLYDEKVRRRRAQIRAEVQKIFEALVDIAIRISEIREVTGCQIPKSFMKDLKELFFKDLSIFDLLDHFEELYDKDNQANLPVAAEFLGEGECEGEGRQADFFFQNERYERLRNDEMERQSILDDCDFNDYLHLMGPWMVELLFPDGSETEVRHLVLGYIVHKLLAVKYPLPNVPVPVDIKPMKPAAVVLGLHEDTAANMLRDLMDPCRILVVHVDDAINFVLSAYKEELSVVRDIDITFQKATEEVLKQKNGKTKDKEVKKKVQLLKSENQEKQAPVEEEFNVYDKQTQTPRMIPEDDPILSHNAEVGKQAFEALGVGDPIPDPVIISAIVAYVISKQDDYDGWVLLNYPLVYSQASDLEFSLTGFRTLPVLEEVESLEVVEEISYRGPWANPLVADDFAESRLSRLVPKPEIFAVTATEIPKTYFDIFIKLKKLSSTPRRRSQDLDDIPPMEKFYFHREILIELEYQNLNFQAVKDLGKEILKKAVTDAEASLEAKTSIEIFGNFVLELNEKWEPKKKHPKETAGGAKKATKELPAAVEFAPYFTEEEEENEEHLSFFGKAPEMPTLPPKPGDPTWEWVSGPQSEEFQMALASLWENMEAVYIEDFKNVFFCLRVHRSNVINYSGFLRKSVKSLISRPDEKQKVLSDFQDMFNQIDEDYRPDVDIKCELYVRVSELEQALMSIADKRKTDSIAELTNLAQDGWVPDEMATLVNTFLSALQLEVDRCTDSCQVIMDYYISIQQKIPEEKPLGKLMVPKLLIQDRKYSIVSNATKSVSSNSHSPRNSDYKRSNKSLSEQSSKLTQEKMGKTRSFGDKRKRSSESSFLVGAAEVIAGILKSMSLPDDGMTPFHSFFIDNVQMVSNDVRSTVEGCILEAKKGDKPAPNASKPVKNTKKNSDTKIPSTSDNLVAEWTTALENELSRFVFRTQLILSRGIFEMNEFLATILNVLSSLMEDLTDMYLKEIQSISECCKVFRCAIEEEVQILPKLVLKEDEFIVEVDDILTKKKDDIVDLAVEDESKKWRFSIEQLCLLCSKLQQIAPDGEIVKRSLVFILEDLRMMKAEAENCSFFPEIWNDIQPDELAAVIDEVYRDLEIVHWKDFIIYALDFPMPTEAQILSMRRAFRNYDPLATELIARENYDCIDLWFEGALGHYKEVERTEKAKELLYKMYQVDDLQTNYTALLLACCKDENPVLGFAKALALAMGKRISLEPERGADDFSEIQGEGFDGDYDSYNEPFDETAKKPYCCPSDSSEVVPKCIPRDKIVRCDCLDQKSSIQERSTDTEMDKWRNYPEKEGEAFYFDSEPFRRSSATSIVSYNILSSLLKASFPSLPQLSILLDCKQTFQETLNSMYNSLESFDGTVTVSKLVKHKFISRLLQTTNKFKFVKLLPLLQSISKIKPATRVLCISDKLNVDYCLRK